MQREARRQMEQTGIGTKSQQALKQQHEQMKVERKVISREMKEAEKQRRFEQKQQKRKEKHKGHWVCDRKASSGIVQAVRQGGFNKFLIFYRIF